MVPTNQRMQGRKGCTTLNVNATSDDRSFIDQSYILHCSNILFWDFGISVLRQIDKESSQIRYMEFKIQPIPTDPSVSFATSVALKRGLSTFENNQYMKETNGSLPVITFKPFKLRKDLTDIYAHFFKDLNLMRYISSMYLSFFLTEYVLYEL